MDDKAVWNKFLGGDRDAFTHIYKMYVNALFNYGIKIVPDSAFVQDCIHDLFVSLWHNKDKMGETSSIKFYLYKSLKRRLIRDLQKKKKQEVNTHKVNLDFNPVFVLSPESEIIERQYSQDMESNLSKAIAGLTKRQQEALFLKFYEGLTNEQIALIMALNTQSIYNIIHQALKMLRQNCKAAVSVILLTLFSLPA